MRLRELFIRTTKVTFTYSKIITIYEIILVNSFIKVEKRHYILRF